jgi:hypothetical protein
MKNAKLCYLYCYSYLRAISARRLCSLWMKGLLNCFTAELEQLFGQLCPQVLNFLKRMILLAGCCCSMFWNFISCAHLLFGFGSVIKEGDLSLLELEVKFEELQICFYYFAWFSYFGQFANITESADFELNINFICCLMFFCLIFITHCYLIFELLILRSLMVILEFLCLYFKEFSFRIEQANVRENRHLKNLYFIIKPNQIFPFIKNLDYPCFLYCFFLNFIEFDL